MNRNFTRTLLTASLVLVMGMVHGQDTTATDWRSTPNLVKWNFGALAFKSISFQYERAVGNRMSVALGLKSMPKSGVPFKSLLENAIDDEDTWNSIKDLKMGNFAITPEVRFYLGESVFKGFYIPPFARYAKYDFTIPFAYTNIDGVEERANFDSNVNTFTGGVLFGAQFKLNKAFYLDWWILGPNWGTANGTLSAYKTLNPIEQEILRTELDNFADDVPIVKLKPSVDGSGARIKVDGPWGGLRSGLSIGYKF